MFKDVAKIVSSFIILFIIMVYLAAQSKAIGSALIMVPLFILWFARYISANTEYRCPKCGFEFKTSTIATLLSLQQIYFRLLRCPKCGDVSWCRIVRYKGKNVEIKAKQIYEKNKTNYKALLITLAAIYVLYLAVWVVKPEIMLLIVVTAVFAYLAAVITYAAINGYNSVMYSYIVFLAVFLAGVMTLIQTLATLKK